ncbi:cobalamin biosynthesis protein CobW [Hwanghaeella grinnelliae]|uniref:Cobalamin biosynthesis protein CobW n=1 Tax=Hwanghaeella grinnelliae TaxID=2500179 RepID=A0A3S2VM80_9PROT|nr:cobalamin biosynthesis protein CobW [Hwanghaeella grinnelliae]RVU36114.1 cobalamin biosynthesis protein CobW [Hwanghaeella grinnelliae]
MARRIPATIISGFLGAGKTTLIRHVIENAKGKRLAFLINEFGDLGIDRDMLLGCGLEGCTDDDIMELANGCICCTVADDFLPTMEKLLDRPDKPDHIVIETSGLALPKPLVKAFNWPEIKAQVTVDGVVTVVDAKALAEGRFADDEDAVQQQREADEALDHDNPLEEVFDDQLFCADIVVLNKVDLLDGAQVDVLEAELQTRLRPGVHLVRSDQSGVDPAVLMGLDKAAEDDLDARPSHHDGADDHDHDDFHSFVLNLASVNDPTALEMMLKSLIEQYDILRIKGFLDRPGLPRREVFQAAGPRLQRYFDRPWRDGENRRSELVVIGLHTIDEAAIRAHLSDWSIPAAAE